MVLTLLSMAGILWMLYANRKEAELKKISAKEDTYGLGGAK